jgi:hypothetical protein
MKITTACFLILSISVSFASDYEICKEIKAPLLAKRFEKLMDHLDKSSLYDPKELLKKVSENKKMSAIDSSNEFYQLREFFNPKRSCPVGSSTKLRTRRGTEYTEPGSIKNYTLQTCDAGDDINGFSIEIVANSPTIELEINDPLNYSDIKGTIKYVNNIAPFDIAFRAECSISLNEEFIYLKDHDGVMTHNFFEVKPYVNSFRCSGAQSKTLDYLMFEARHGEEKVSLEKLKEMKEMIIAEMTEDACKAEDKRDDGKSNDFKRALLKQIEDIKIEDPFKSLNSLPR